jgi:hypothetical protein
MSRAKKTVIAALVLSSVLHLLAWWLLARILSSPPQAESGTTIRMLLSASTPTDRYVEPSVIQSSSSKNSHQAEPRESKTQTKNAESSAPPTASDLPSDPSVQASSQEATQASDNRIGGPIASVAKKDIPEADRLRLPAPVTLVFESFDGLVNSAKMEGHLKWSYQDGRYQIELLVNTGSSQLALFRSEGLINSSGLSPETFSHQVLQEPPVQAAFATIKSSSAEDLARQDPLSALIQLAAILNSDPKKYRVVNRLEVPLHQIDSSLNVAATGTTPTEFDPLSVIFSLQPEVDISLPFANMQVKPITQSQIMSSPSSLSPIQSAVWLAPQLEYLPAKFMLALKLPTQRGNESSISVDMRLKLVRRQ